MIRRFPVRADALVANLLAFGVPLGLYALSLPPGVRFWDTGEMQTVPYILGIAHPTGFPVFALAGWVFSHCFTVGNVAWRISLMSAIAMAVAAGCVHQIVVRLGGARIAGLAAAWVFAAGGVAWSRGSRAEVHAFAAMFAALAMVAIVMVRCERRPRAVYLLAAATGLGIANHPVAVFFVPGAALVAYLAYREIGRRRLLVAGLIFAGACSLYLYLPARSAIVFAQRIDPTLALGIPAGRPYWDYDHPSSREGFLAEVSGSDFHASRALSSIASPREYHAVGTRFWPVLVREFGGVALLLALAGWIALARRDFALAGTLVVCAFLPVPYVVNYPAESDVERYFLASFVAVAAFAGFGADRLARVLLGHDQPRLGAALACFTLVVSSAALVRSNGHLLTDWRNDYTPDRWIDRVAEATPDDAVVVTFWNYATPLAYGAYVDGRLGHRIVVTAFPADYQALYPRWLHDGRPLFVRGDGPPDLDPALGLIATPVDIDDDLYRIDLGAGRKPRLKPRTARRAALAMPR